MDTLSQGSQRSSFSGVYQQPRKVFVNDEFVDSEYLVKGIMNSATSQLLVETPEIIKQKVHGDKQAIIRLMQIYDTTISAANKPNTLFMAKAIKQRNNFDASGNQTDIIGYGVYCQQVDKWQLDSQFFQMDSLYPVKIQLYIDKRDGNGYQVYMPSQNNQNYIQYDIQINYNFI